jgi:membrane-bound serine protease (ClpP class)
MSVIIGLLILGFALIALEIFIPGGIVGIFGGISLLAAVGFAYESYAMEGAIIVFGVGLVGVVACLWFEFKVLPKTAAGKKFFLQDQVTGKSQSDVCESDWVGKQGTTATALSPTGYVIVEGRKFEAYSRSGFLDKGELVKVDSFDQFKVTVSKV